MVPSSRHPGESRDPPFNIEVVAKWTPAFAVGESRDDEGGEVLSAGRLASTKVAV